jgi:Arc/MetJ-type ribon-helix-helix transcriptional regulator
MVDTSSYSDIEKELEKAYNTILNTTPLTTELLGPTVEKIRKLVEKGIYEYVNGELKREIKDELKTETIKYEIALYKSYLEDLSKLWEKMSKIRPWSVDTLESLIEQMNKLKPCGIEICLYPDNISATMVNTGLIYLQDTIIRTFKEYAERIDHYDEISHMAHVMNYISAYPVAQAILGTYLVKWYKEFSKLKEQLNTSNDIKTAMNILESSYQNAANYIKEAVELLLKGLDNERKFLDMIGLKSILKEEEINDQNREYVIKEANEVRKAIENVLKALSKGSYEDENID